MVWISDLRFALRGLRRSPGVVGFVVLTLAVGIAGTTAMFGVVDTVVLEPLPFERPEELVRVWEHRPQQGRERNPVSPADFFDWREGVSMLQDLTAHARGGVNLTGRGEPERLLTAYVSDRYFELLGVAPRLGRTFATSEQTPGESRVAILSHGLWTRRFASDPDIVSRTIRLDGAAHDVIGVMPPGFDFPEACDLWLPLALEPELRRARGMHYLIVQGRLAKGRHLDEARAEMAEIAARLEARHPEVNTGHTARVEPLADELLGELQEGLWMLLGVSAFVLLICCANVANVWLARGASREREVAVAAALGAGTMRLIRPLLLESVVVVAAAGSIGMLAAAWLAKPLLSAVVSGRTPSSNVDIVAAACVVSAVALLLFGLYPALRVSSLGVVGALRTTRSVSSGGPKALKKLLVVVEVALALVLVMAAVLFVKSFGRLSAVDPGFRTDGVLAIRLSLPDAKYAEPYQRSAFFDELLHRVDALSNVTAAASTTILPLSGGDAGRFFDIEGRPPSAPGESPNARIRSVSPGYFRTMGIPLVRGRDVSARDDAEAPRVVVASQRLVDDYFPSQDPLGARLSFGDDDTYEIVGVVGDVRHTALDVEPSPHAYFASAQRAPRSATIVLRTSGDPLELVDRVREAVWAMDRDQPLASIDLLSDLERRSMADARKLKNAMALFALLALIVAASGVYGVMAYLAVMRSREIAVRMALGARLRDVVTLVVREGMTLVAVGVGVALVGATLSSKLVERFLFEVEPFDVGAWWWSVAILLAAGILAALLPALRSAHIDPTSALRAE